MAITGVLFVLVFGISPGFGQTPSSQLFSLEFNTPSEIGLDIIFIPENYTLDEMDKFSETVETYYLTLLSVDPFSEFKDRINVWRIDTTVDFGSKRSPTSERLITVDEMKVKQFVGSVRDFDLDGVPPNDLVIVLVDDLTYGGSGAADVVVTYTGLYGSDVMLHELGHSFGGLGDEYVVYDEDYPAGNTIPYPNVDWNGSKWEDVPGTGAYLGAWYRNLVRPTYDSCVMRRITYSGFCPVCRRALVSLLEYYTPSVPLQVSVGIPGIEVIIDGTSYTAYDGHVNVIVEKGLMATISVGNPIVIDNNTKYVFAGWSGDAFSNETTVSIVIDSPMTVKANWLRQFYVRVVSPHSLAVGSGWYDAGSTADFSLESESVSVEGLLGLLGAKYVFQGWTGDYIGKSLEGSLVINMPQTIVAEWDTDFTTLYIYIGIAIVVVIVSLNFVRRRRLKHEA